MAVQKRWVHYNLRWRLMNISESDSRFAGSAAYDPDVEGNGRPDARLSAADVREGRTVEDIQAEQQRIADEKEAAEQAAADEGDDGDQGDDGDSAPVRTASRAPAKKTARKSTGRRAAPDGGEGSGE